ncbi:MAG: alpha/beta hydrolase [Bacteroidales bacterium]|nr:alpha/beta hydrolase [Bacteroidales bacterium]
MKKMLYFSAFALFCLAVSCQHETAEPAAAGLTEPTATVLLYPEGQDVDSGIVEDGVTVTLGPGESNEAEGPEMLKESSGNIANVGDSARMILYLPEKANGQMVIICPGGGYSNLAMRHEGRWVAEWLTARGIAACVLVYRMPRGTHPQAPITDVQNAFRYCRHHAAEWGVEQIGVMGFSAGGHLAGCASTLFVDEITRPDFSILVYSVLTFDPAVKKKGTFEQMTDKGAREDLRAYYSLENRITEQTPPALLLLCEDDKGVVPEHSWRYFEQLRLHGVPAELHIFPSGGHGWGWKTPDYTGKEDPLGAQREVFFHCVENYLERMSLNR